MPTAASADSPAIIAAVAPPGSSPCTHEALVASLYADLRAIAVSYFARQPVGHTLQPTALVNEAVLKIIRDQAAGHSDRWSSPGHFLAVAATAMRQVLVDYARASAALKRGSGAVVNIDTSSIAAPRPTVDVIELSEAIDRLAALDERAARVVSLRFFAGLTISQAAAALGVSDFTVENDWRAARAFLARELSPRRSARAGR
jgi:RNA polymerase sigma-70 factor (ECF subfamily)